MSSSQNFRLPLARVAFPNFIKPTKSENGKETYNGTLLFPKSETFADTKDGKGLITILRETAIAEWGDKAVQWIKDEVIKLPILDGDGKQAVSKKTGIRSAGFAGHHFVRVQANIDHRPQIFNAQMLPDATPGMIYGGCYVYPVVNVWTWDHPTNGKGISAGLIMVQFVKDGERFGGGVSDPKQFFNVIEDQTDAPASVKSGAGAAALFE